MPRRRHLFDNGYPVATATLLAGSEVLLAVARRGLQTSHERIAASLFRMADCSHKILDSELHCASTRKVVRGCRVPDTVKR